MPGPCDVSIVLVGLNARNFILECLASIYAAEWRGMSYEIVYVDNGSRDDSVQCVDREYPAVRIVAKDRNVGYTPAANEGASLTTGRYLLFLNDDTLVLQDAIPLQVEFLDAHPGVGIVGNRLLYPDHTEQYSARRFPQGINALLGRRGLLSRLLGQTRFMKRYLYKEELRQPAPFPCDWVSAAGEMVRRECWEHVGGFPEDYYYWHETLFSHRAAQRGWSTYLHPESKVIHYEGHGSGPRPYAAQRFHIQNFHDGAFRLYRELHPQSRGSLTAGIVWLGLQLRKWLCLARAWCTSLIQPVATPFSAPPNFPPGSPPGSPPLQGIPR